MRVATRRGPGWEVGRVRHRLGSTFARRELQTILLGLLAAVDTIELDGEPEWARANFVGGVKRLPVTATFRLALGESVPPEPGR